ncbi:MAG: uroporphyrinogen-III C-methyltransferase [Lentisphaerae bacterium]|jgi:uroporphyrinogen III methyltransferase / synthase|nr:uroporphyrinogen-III C-methyltransferase [Lentisphaerota bacterium]MBT4820179.1 uroporphyrinogen-III C-methyltransferase [Lentisphaerota bacterium]MBT5610956.1 uroporphyrinogen-III C-methyltransferase [Lentisphaerota bacterium]MBT7062212.1 uroporphyrinogen-III C-methyltransferase [Lentisphaerota bacterium]MBT7848052.1 uroporphyrinogen-III C-methyltransferase [Lentisphaerota bacterium]
MSNQTNKTGKVYLVGAGPGDPGLLTLKGADCLRRCDCVIYDYLANPVLLDLAPAEAERLYVGKKAGRHSMPQDQICERLVARGQAGDTVVRLKGGDPFVFGRGGEEARALAEAGVPFEVVPGVTAAIAAGAYAGIPVTDRTCNSVLTLVTGHEDPTKSESRIDWASLARGGGTLAFYMGVGQLPRIAAELRENGRASNTPVAVIRHGTLPTQRTLTGTLANIADKVEQNGLKPPAMILVGDVVELREQMGWFECLPLFGKTVAITRPLPQLTSMEAQLRALGAEVLRLPSIAIAPPTDAAPLETALQDLNSVDWVLFTSGNGVAHVFAALSQLGLDTRAFGGCRIAAIGSATATSLRQHGLIPDVVPEQFTSRSLIQTLVDQGLVHGQRFLLPRADIAPAALPEALAEAGAAEVSEVTAYRTVPGTPEEAVLSRLREGTIDTVTFTSASTAANYAALCQEHLGAVPTRPAHVSIGPETSRALRELGLEIAVEATTHTPAGVVEALVG